jgi:3-deoxy-D-manno-octulosonic-acid transferase
LLVDTLGELLSRRRCERRIRRRHFVPVGGHNLPEPAALPIIVVGPHTFNAADIAQNFLKGASAS